MQIVHGIELLYEIAAERFRTRWFAAKASMSSGARVPGGSFHSCHQRALDTRTGSHMHTHIYIT